MKWSVLIDNTTYGPYSMEEMIKYINEGRIRKDMFVWKGGMAEWKRIQEISEFSYLFQTVQPSKPPKFSEFKNIINSEKFKFKNKLFLIIPAAIIFSIIIITFFVFIFPNLTKDNSTTLDSKIQVTQTSNEVSVTLPEWVLPEGSKIEVIKDENPPAMSDSQIVLQKAYDINLPKDNNMDGIAEISIPFDKKLISSGSSPEDSVGAAYYNTKTNEWELIPCAIDENNNKITIYTDHFSKYAAVIFKDGRKKFNETLSKFDLTPTTFYNKSDLEKIVSEGKELPEQSPTALEKGWNRFNDLYSLTGAGSTVVEAGVGTETLKNVNKLMNEAGLGFALSQLAFDLYKGGKSDAAQNFAKNGAFYSVSKWGGDALGLASAGVTFIDYSVNKFGEAALNKNLQKWDGAYKKYYATELKPNKSSLGDYDRRTVKGWYDIIAKLHMESKNSDELKNKLDKEVADYCNAFWNDPEAMAYVADSTPGIRGFGAGGEDAAGKEKISNNYKLELLEYKIRPAFASYMKKQWFYINLKAESDFNKLKEEMNKQYTITVQLENYKNVKDLKAATVRFTNQKGNAIHSQSFDSNGQATIKTSLFGFLKSGSPLNLEVSVPEQEKTPAFKTKLIYKLENYNTLVNVKYTSNDEPSEGILFEDTFNRADSGSSGNEWQEVKLRNGTGSSSTIRQDGDTPWCISNNTLSYSGIGNNSYTEDFIETVKEFPINNTKVEFEIRGTASTELGYVGPAVFWAPAANMRLGSFRVSNGAPSLIGLQAFYGWESKGTNGLVYYLGGSNKDTNGILAGINSGEFVKHTIIIKDGMISHQTGSNEAVTYDLVNIPSQDAKRHLSFDVRYYDKGVPFKTEIKNLKISTLK